VDENILPTAILPDKTESLVGLVHFNGTNTFGGRAYDLRRSSRASLRRGARTWIIWPSSGCSVVRLLIVVITAALRSTVVVFVTAHSTPARLQQQRMSRFLRELSQEGLALWLTLLMPDIVEAILNGRQPAGLQLSGLTRRFPVG
jgi:hypothetical protein